VLGIFSGPQVSKIMTLEPYDPERLDRMCLRVFDLCARLRTLARQSRDQQLAPIELHDRKALEWLDNFEEWLFRAEGAMTRSMHKTRGERRAREIQSNRTG
jgi:hypothetical protein